MIIVYVIVLACLSFGLGYTTGYRHGPKRFVYRPIVPAPLAKKTES